MRKGGRERDGEGKLVMERDHGEETDREGKTMIEKQESN